MQPLYSVFSQMKHTGQITPNIGKRPSKTDLKSDTETDSQPALSQSTSSDIVSDNELSKESEKFSKGKGFIFNNYKIVFVMCFFDFTRSFSKNSIHKQGSKRSLKMTGK